VDVSAPMLEAARARPSRNVTFLEADAQTHPFAPASFDGAFSRFGVMFFSDPVAAFANVARALRPGGRIAFVCWRRADEQEWVRLPVRAASEHVRLDLMPDDGPGPFSLGDRERLEGVLARAGYVEIDTRPVDRGVLLGGRGGLDTAMGFILTSRLGRQLREAGAGDEALTAVRRALEPFSTDLGVEIGAAVWVASALRRG